MSKKLDEVTSTDKMDKALDMTESLIDKCQEPDSENEQSGYYKKCTDCNGDGYIIKYCCSGIDYSDGSISCGCYGMGVDEDCTTCDGVGKIFVETLKKY